MEARKKVCIIDDEMDIREIYSMKLKSYGYEIIEAANGQQGLDAIRANAPDIILLDLLMPVKDGVDVMLELKDDEKFSKIPIIIFSNIDDDETLKKIGKNFETRFFLIKALTTPEKVAKLVREVVH